jgi:hypothetical protein
MYGGLLKTASAAAILAAAGLFGASSAKAADLGGDCCADLEERVAELEATTVRKGNRKVSVTLSGFVGHNVMWWDDGHQSDVYFGDGGNYFSRFRFVGTAKISPTVTAGFLYEFGIDNNRIGNATQQNGGDDLPINQGGAFPVVTQNGRNDVLRDSTVWLRHSQLGMIKVGHGSTSTDNLVLIDLAGMNGAGTPDLGLYMGGFRLRSTAGVFQGANLTWGRALTGTESWDTSRRNHVMYEAPTIAGFTLQAAVAEDNYWDVALRYAGEFGGFRLAFGIGYQEDSEFNNPANGTSIVAGSNSVACTSLCDVKTQEVKGSASLLHVPTGLFVTGSGGQRQLDGALTAGVPDLTYWHVAAGVSQNFFGFGKTVLFGEYGEHKGGLAQTDFLVGATGTDSKVTNWGLGVNQFIDAAAMEVFLTYKHFEIDAPGVAPLSDLNVVIGGARVNF